MNEINRTIDIFIRIQIIKLYDIDSLPCTKQNESILFMKFSKRNINKSQR